MPDQRVTEAMRVLWERKDMKNYSALQKMAIQYGLVPVWEMYPEPLRRVVELVESTA